MSSNNVMENIIDKAKAIDKYILLPDGIDERSIHAARKIVDQGIAKIALLGSEDQIKSKAKTLDVSLDGVDVIEPIKHKKYDDFVSEYFELRKPKGMTEEQAKTNIANPLFFGGMMLRHNMADGSVAGSLSTTGDVIRAGLHTIGVKKGLSTVSSFFLIVFPDKVYSFADGAVLPDPSERQLADIAIVTAENYKRLIGEEPRVAMLSFSTYGSAEHDMVTKVQNATKMVKEKQPSLLVDGDVQLDSAIVPKIAQKKCPNSPIEGKANVLIFPDLDAGNIGYKMAQRMAGAEAIGPVVQGLKKPAFDLSRGCSIDDIVSVTAINCVMGD